ncbi:hypothetical protein P7K49_025132 [Saguinus oedipus]|uniref:Uncharacterized protein n=1 Tax=Saguinus oedipus TaxID=9490 RepID=A0ABQ9UHN6_SAGOE|nr:hypothetical protein P7K49_025132 [Saguinus oedipus]
MLVTVASQVATHTSQVAADGERRTGVKQLKIKGEPKEGPKLLEFLGYPESPKLGLLQHKGASVDLKWEDAVCSGQADVSFDDDVALEDDS